MKARSPYQRHAKRPHQYSAELRAWRQNPTAANDDAWRRMMTRRGGFAFVPDAPRIPRGHSFPPGVLPFNPHTKPAAKPFMLMAAE